MNKKNDSTLDAAALIALRTSLRGDLNALAVFTEKLGVKQMGPADHIRTKHEVKAFLQSGGLAEAAKIAENVRARISWQEAHTQQQSQRQGQQLSQ